MNILTSAKSDYLIEASLEYLHEENRAWQSDLNFWSDETKFFLALMKNKHVKAIMEGKSQIYDNAYHAMISYKDKILVKLKSETVDHERYLAKLLQKKDNETDTLYREKHKELREKIKEFENNFKKTKKEFFIVMEDWS